MRCRKEGGVGRRGERGSRKEGEKEREGDRGKGRREKVSEWEGRERVREAGRKVSRGTERGCKGQSQGKRERCVWEC